MVSQQEFSFGPKKPFVSGSTPYPGDSAYPTAPPAISFASQPFAVPSAPPAYSMGAGASSVSYRPTTGTISAPGYAPRAVDASFGVIYDLLAELNSETPLKTVTTWAWMEVTRDELNTYYINHVGELIRANKKSNSEGSLEVTWNLLPNHRVCALLPNGGILIENGTDVAIVKAAVAQPIPYNIAVILERLKRYVAGILHDNQTVSLHKLNDCFLGNIEFSCNMVSLNTAFLGTKKQVYQVSWNRETGKYTYNLLLNLEDEAFEDPIIGMTVVPFRDTNCVVVAVTANGHYAFTPTQRDAKTFIPHETIIRESLGKRTRLDSAQIDNIVRYNKIAGTVTIDSSIYTINKYIVPREPELAKGGFFSRMVSSATALVVGSSHGPGASDGLCIGTKIWPPGDSDNVLYNSKTGEPRHPIPNNIKSVRVCSTSTFSRVMVQFNNNSTSFYNLTSRGESTLQAWGGRRRRGKRC